MQAMLRALLVIAPAHVHATAAPIAKVLSMLTDLQQQIIKDGEVVHGEYAKYAEWCEDRSRDLGYEIKSGKAAVEQTQATISEETATGGSLETKVEELAVDITKNEADLKEATKLRAKEAADFSAEEKELMETIDMLERATGILEKEMRKGGASMMQLQSAGNLVQALTAMVKASLIGSSDAAALTAFVQSTQQSDDEDSEPLGAPAATAYKSQSGGVVDTMEDLTEKAESQLAEVRKKESTALQNYNLLKQALESEIKFAKKDMGEAKKSIAASEETKSGGEGDLDVTSKELAADIKAKSVLHHDCMSRAEAFEVETKSRDEELKAIAKAKKFIQESMGGADLNQVSFVQLSRARKSETTSQSTEVVRLIRELGHKQHSGMLVQLASQIASASRSGENDDVFAKVRGLISDMIGKLEDAAGADAAKKEYCDREMSETTVKKSDKVDEIKSQSTKIEQMGAKSALLKQDVASLESQLSKLLKSQAQLDKLRQEEKAEYEKAKAGLGKGLNGVKLALNVLNEYYAQGDKDHSSSEGAGNSIIGLLEIIEADLSKQLAEITSDEETAVAEYEDAATESKVEQAQKDQDVKYKTRESKQLDKTSAEQNSDRIGVQAELIAMTSYLAQLKRECVAKADNYEDRKAGREAEIRGLKEALDILESETALVQRHAVHRTLRGVQPHKKSA